MFRAKKIARGRADIIPPVMTRVRGRDNAQKRAIADRSFLQDISLPFFSVLPSLSALSP